MRHYKPWKTLLQIWQSLLAKIYQCGALLECTSQHQHSTLKNQHKQFFNRKYFGISIEYSTATHEMLWEYDVIRSKIKQSCNDVMRSDKNQASFAWWSNWRNAFSLINTNFASFGCEWNISFTHRSEGTTKTLENGHWGVWSSWMLLILQPYHEDAFTKHAQKGICAYIHHFLCFVYYMYHNWRFG